jgi:hypothetical protein
MNEGLIKQGEFWIRHEDQDKHKLTPNSRYWERAKPTSFIDRNRNSLKIDVLDLTDQVPYPYMVALLHDEQDREIPMPLGK